METPILKAARIAGGQSALARRLGVTPQAVQQWCSGNRIPAGRVVEIEATCGVPREALRPDLYQKGA